MYDGTSFNFSQTSCNVPLCFLRNAEFDLANKKENSLNGQIIRYSYEQVHFSVFFSRRANWVKPKFRRTLGKIV